VKRYLLIMVLLAAAAQRADGQVWKKIKEAAKAKVEAQKTKTATHVVEAAGTVVDSTLEKSGRGVDSAVTKVGTVADTAMNATERGVKGIASGVAGAFKGDGLQQDLAKGRAVVAGIRFAAGSDQIEPSSASTITRLAKAILGTSGTFLIESHTAATSDATAEQALTDRRASAVKARLVAEGVPAARLFSMGFGATKPPAQQAAKTSAPRADRIEVSRMQ
jgi:outer membrane protein OmpA-like peptidoglycan-associated protein